MIIFYVFIFLILNFIIYKIVKNLKNFNFQFIFTIILAFIVRALNEYIENTTAHSIIVLSGFSVSIPFFSFCLMSISNHRKTTKKVRSKINNYLELKIDNYIMENNNYALHFAIIITSYQLVMLLSGMFIELK